jgi:(2Fe-2S) ferredoxin
MQASAPRFKKHIFICENERSEGKCCAPDGSHLREILKTKLKEIGLSSQIRVSRSGCLDVCADGPNILLMPDNIWFKKVAESDLSEIIAAASKGVA